MSVIYGNPIITNGGGVKLNIDYGSTPPTDTTKLWVPLEKKPDAVECSPVISFGSEVFATEQGSFDGNLYAEAQQNNIVGTKIYQYCGDYGGLNPQNSVYWYDYATKQTGSSAISGSTVKKNQNTSISVGDKIYSFGGRTSNGTTYNKVDVYDTTTNTFSNPAQYPNNLCIGASCAYKDGKIYIAGGYSGSLSIVSQIQVFNVSTNKFETAIGFRGMYAVHCSSIFVGDNLYVIGGNTSSDNTNSHVLKININDGSLEHILQLSRNVYAPVVACFDNRHIYVLGGPSTGSVTNPSYKIDTVTNTYEQLSGNFSAYSFGAAYGIVGNKVYVLGGGPSFSLAPTVRAVRSFTAQSDLTNNHLFLQEDYGYDFLWSAIKSKDADLKVKVINAYLGDSNNIAQPTNAYLYDTATNKWKTLTGESYVADMQNALNILGVT